MIEEQQKREAERVRCNRPSWAKAVIIAELDIDDCHLQSDYFNVKKSRRILLAWSKHTRDLFGELRKVAACSKIPEIQALAAAPEEAEHREKWSMGAGYYLKITDRYSTGWQVRKWRLDYRGSDVELLAGDPETNHLPEIERVKVEGSAFGRFESSELSTLEDWT